MTIVGRLPTGCRAQNAPVPFRAESATAVLFPHVVEGGVQDSVSGKMLLDTGDCRPLILQTGDGNSVCLPRVTVSTDSYILGGGDR